MHSEEIAKTSQGYTSGAVEVSVLSFLEYFSFDAIFTIGF